MINFSLREKKIIGMTIIVIIVAVLINFFNLILPDKNHNDIDSLERYTKLYEKYSYQRQLARDYAPLVEKYKDVLATKLSYEEASAALFSTVKSIVQKQGSVIERIKPKQVKSKEIHKEISFEIELVGTFVQVFKTINSLETHNQLINLNSVKIIPISKESNTIRCTTVISRPFFE